MAQSRVDRTPGRRRAEPLPAPKPVRLRRWSALLVISGWLLLAVAGTAAVVATRTPATVASWVPTTGAVVVTALLASALSARTGGRPQVAGTLALVLAAVAVLSAGPGVGAAAAGRTAGCRPR